MNWRLIGDLTYWVGPFVSIGVTLWWLKRRES